MRQRREAVEQAPAALAAAAIDVGHGDEGAQEPASRGGGEVAEDLALPPAPVLFYGVQVPV